MKLPVFIGWDPREPEAFAVCAHTLRAQAGCEVEIHGVRLDELRRDRLYTRATERRDGRLWDVVSGAPMSTEFAVSRFFVPHLAARAGLRKGWALFCDCDFLWFGDVAEILAEADPNAALCCVQHMHEPTEAVKMDGQAQLLYARKNWSSLMLFNLGHPAHEKLDLATLNGLPGRDLHRFCWLADEEIGALPSDWNWLEGWSPVPDKPPRAVHFTRGGPWMPGWEHVRYAAEWRKGLSGVRA